MAGRAAEARAFVAAAYALALTGARAAAADEPHLPAEPRTMREPGEPVAVADAFDEGDAFDLHVGLDYELSSRSARIHRRSGATTRAVASYGQGVSRLTPRLEVGLYRDLAFVLRLPLVLSDARRLDLVDGDAGIVRGLPGETLFRVPFLATERSGLEHLELGVVAAPLSELAGRGPFDLRVGASVRVALGDPMQACRQDPPDGQVECAHPADVDRDGVADPDEPDARGPVTPGVTRGTLGIEGHVVAAKRLAALEPHLGARVLVEVPTSAIWDAPTGGVGPSAPPVQLGATLGLGVVPWENRERFSRLTIDGSAELEFRTRGRDFSELFDVLGTSVAPSLRAPVERGGVRAYVSGLDVVDAHARVGAATSVMWQPSALVKIGASLRVAWDTAHDVTAERPCGDASCAGEPTNPAYREVIHGDATRFSVESATTVAFGARGAVMF